MVIAKTTVIAATSNVIIALFQALQTALTVTASNGFSLTVTVPAPTTV